MLPRDGSYISGTGPGKRKAEDLGSGSSSNPLLNAAAAKRVKKDVTAMFGASAKRKCMFLFGSLFRDAFMTRFVPWCSEP